MKIKKQEPAIPHIRVHGWPWRRAAYKVLGDNLRPLQASDEQGQQGDKKAKKAKKDKDNKGDDKWYDAETQNLKAEKDFDRAVQVLKGNMDAQVTAMTAVVREFRADSNAAKVGAARQSLSQSQSSQSRCALQPYRKEAAKAEIVLHLRPVCQ